MKVIFMKQTLRAMFQAQVKRTPSNIALRTDSKIFTYYELLKHAQHLSEQIKPHIQTPETLIAIRGQRSAEFIIAILGVVLAGGAYVPLDLLYDPQLHHRILEDAQPDLIIDVNDQETSPFPYNIILNLSKETHDQGSDSHSGEVLPHHLAYVIYTSGVTGDPKGVMIENRSICSRIEVLSILYDIKENDIFFHNSPYGFDGSVEEIFLPLLTGAQLVIAPPGKPQDMLEDLSKHIEHHKITTLYLMPSLWGKFADILQSPSERASCHSLKRLIGGGDTLFPHILKELQSLLNIGFYYIYGPTENTINTTLWACHWSKNMDIMPVGYPLPHTNIHILDHDFRPLPHGEIGDIYLSGIGLARGYINKKELTDARFNTFGHSFRLYKSRDIGRILPSGLLEYIGRRECDLKTIDDYCIIGKIESFLASREEIKEVIMDIEKDGEIIAFLSLRNKEFPFKHQQDLEKALHQQIKKFGVPINKFIFVPAFPYSPPGKVDLRVLHSNKQANIEKSL